MSFFIVAHLCIRVRKREYAQKLFGLGFFPDDDDRRKNNENEHLAPG